MQYGITVYDRVKIGCLFGYGIITEMHSARFFLKEVRYECSDPLISKTFLYKSANTVYIDVDKEKEAVQLTKKC